MTVPFKHWLYGQLASSCYYGTIWHYRLGLLWIWNSAFGKTPQRYVTMYQDWKKSKLALLTQILVCKWSGNLTFDKERQWYIYNEKSLVQNRRNKITITALFLGRGEITHEMEHAVPTSTDRKICFLLVIFLGLSKRHPCSNLIRLYCSTVRYRELTLSKSISENDILIKRLSQAQNVKSPSLVTLPLFPFTHVIKKDQRFWHVHQLSSDIFRLTDWHF